MKLKPCPFCGAEAKVKDNYVECMYCRCRLPLSKDWNKRVLDENIKYDDELVKAINLNQERPHLTDIEMDYLEHMNKFYGNTSDRYLISPNGEILYVDNEHCKFICDILGLRMNDEMNESEIDFCEFFIIYALFLGYIRAKVFKNQIAIQYEVLNEKSVDTLFKFLSEKYNNGNYCIVIEKLTTKTFEIFDNLSDAYQHFYSGIKIKYVDE